jgi:hypothetical protein
MRLNLLADFDWESRVDKVLDELDDAGYHEYFEDRDYGPGSIDLTVVFMCQNPALNLKRRIRLSAKERKLYIDVMLNLPLMISASHEERRQMVLDRLLSDVVPVIQSRRLPGFDTARFIADLASWVNEAR